MESMVNTLIGSLIYREEAPKQIEAPSPFPIHFPCGCAQFGPEDLGLCEAHLRASDESGHVGPVNGRKVKSYLDSDEDVAVVNICDLMESLDPNAFDRDYSDPQKALALDEALDSDVKEWVEEANAHYYAAERSFFSVPQAAQAARLAGKKIVVVEDYS